MKRLFGSLWALAALGSGCTCGPGFCQSVATFQSKFHACDAGQLTVVPCYADPGKCATAYDTCSFADQNALSNQYACLQAQPDCKPGEEVSWLQAYGACKADAGPVSGACLTAFDTQFPGGC